MSYEIIHTGKLLFLTFHADATNLQMFPFSRSLECSFLLEIFLSFLSGQEWGQVIIFMKMLEFQIMPTHFHNQLEVFD